jgi:hypothetical protein
MTYTNRYKNFIENLISKLAISQHNSTKLLHTYHNKNILICHSSVTMTGVFPFFFLSCKANAGVKLAKMGHDPHSYKLVVICVVLCIVCICVVLCIVCV